MRKLFLYGVLTILSCSCNKKEVCSTNESDEVWLVIKDTNGTSLIDSLYTDTPTIQGGSNNAELGVSGYHPERVIVSNGVEDLSSWKLNLDNTPNGGIFQLSNLGIPGETNSVSTGEDFYFEIELEIEPKVLDGCLKKYTKGRLLWIRVEDTTFYGPGIHTYLQN